MDAAVHGHQLYLCGRSRGDCRDDRVWDVLKRAYFTPACLKEGKNICGLSKNSCSTKCSTKIENPHKQQLYTMEYTGFEPVASTMRMWRAPNCANTPFLTLGNHHVRFPHGNNGARTHDLPLVRRALSQLSYASAFRRLL